MQAKLVLVQMLMSMLQPYKIMLLERGVHLCLVFSLFKVPGTSASQESSHSHANRKPKLAREHVAPPNRIKRDDS